MAGYVTFEGQGNTFEMETFYEIQAFRNYPC
jgi:hypothetical protein